MVLICGVKLVIKIGKGVQEAQSQSSNANSKIVLDLKDMK